VEENLLRVVQNLDLGVVDHEVADANPLADDKFGHIHGQLTGNILGQALDLDLAVDLLQQAPLLLDAHGLAAGLHRHLDAQALVHGDAQEVDMHQVPLDGLELPVANHGRGLALPLDREGKDGVVAGLGAENALHHASVDTQRFGLRLAAVDDRRHLAVAAQLPGAVLASPLAGQRFDYHSLHRSLLLDTATARGRRRISPLLTQTAC
jgi:hypothetical protein